MAEQNQGNQGGTGMGAGGMGGGATGGAGNGGGAAGATDATGRLEATRTHARQAAEELRTAATEIAGQYRGRSEQAWCDAQQRARTLQEDGEQYVRENPTKAVFSALGIGFVLGLIFRR
ncbi:MAG TPA: hypothetical protein VK993_11625 [Chthoniobacterales bacterium]|nr:hypothetical protein [Chthoniobacterales bacterium]